MIKFRIKMNNQANNFLNQMVLKANNLKGKNSGKSLQKFKGAIV
jgi:hypothetical protein